MFDNLRLSIVVTTEVFINVLADVLADITIDIIADIANRTDLKVRVKIRQPKELKVLLIAVYCWDSLKS